MGIFAFFPWLSIDDAHQVGEFWLLPYRQGMEPAGKGSPDQTIMDNIAGCYWQARTRTIDDAVVVALDRQRLLRRLSDDEIESVFELAELLALAGIADRPLFTPAPTYCNRDQFRVVVQAFTDGQATGITVQSRRRDGQTLSAWPIELFRVDRPDHIRQAWSMDASSELLAALARARSHPVWPSYWQALVSFNQANTDAPTITPATEVVFLMSAFERLMNAAPNDNDMLAHFDDLFAPSSRIATTDCARLVSGAKQFKKARFVGQAWLLDFWHLRGHLAHGRAVDGLPVVWSLAEHLLLGSFLFPLLVKVRLQVDGLYTLSDNDNDLVAAFEHLAAADDLLAGTLGADGMKAFVWNEIIYRTGCDRLLERVLASLDTDSNSPGPSSSGNESDA